MQPLLKQYLTGGLASSGTLQKGQVTLTNGLNVPVWAGFLAPDGTVYPLVQASTLTPVNTSGPINWYWVVWGLDGGLLGVFAPVTSSPLTITVGAADLSDPGDIGPVPTPSSDVLIPDDSQSVLVGCGQAKNDTGTTYIMRSQFWKRSGDSITLEATETVTTNYTS